LIRLPIEAIKKHKENWPGRAIEAAEIERKIGTMKRMEGLT
jgi:hypothetical protein